MKNIHIVYTLSEHDEDSFEECIYGVFIDKERADKIAESLYGFVRTFQVMDAE